MTERALNYVFDLWQVTSKHGQSAQITLSRQGQGGPEEIVATVDSKGFVWPLAPDRRTRLEFSIPHNDIAGPKYDLPKRDPA